MGLFSKDIKTLDDLFVHQLRDIYYAENQIVQALPEMIEKATDAGLKRGFRPRRPLGIRRLLLLRRPRRRAAHLEQLVLVLPLALLALLLFWWAMICSAAQPASATSCILVVLASLRKCRPAMS